MSAEPEIEDAIASLDDFNPGCMVKITTGYTFFGVWFPTSMIAGCGIPSVCVIRCRNCRAAAYACEDHRARCARDERATCTKCGAVGISLDLFEFLPLGGSG